MNETIHVAVTLVVGCVWSIIGYLLHRAIATVEDSITDAKTDIDHQTQRIDTNCSDIAYLKGIIERRRK